MIGSHDTFTYLKSTNPLFNLFSRWWKTQCKTIEEQYIFGVRFFDIRVTYKKGWWIPCHGYAAFDMKFESLKSICEYMKKVAPKAIYRIVFERGYYLDERVFSASAQALCKAYPNLWRMDIKSHGNWMGECANNNEYLYHKGYKFAKGYTWQAPAYELTGHVTTKNFYKTDLRKEAKKINNKLDFFQSRDKLQQMIDSKDEFYLLDYCTNEY